MYVNMYICSSMCLCAYVCRYAPATQVPVASSLGADNREEAGASRGGEPFKGRKRCRGSGPGARRRRGGDDSHESP